MLLVLNDNTTEAVIENDPKVAQEVAVAVSQPDPWSGAVFKLTQYVLGILACVLLMLFLPLIYQEYRFSKLAAEAYGGSVQSLIISPPAASAPAASAPAPANGDVKGAPAGAVPAGPAAAAPPAPMESVEHMKARQELLRAYQDSANQARDFWKGMAQMILLNLLLPVLTGLLGYVFAKGSGRP